jgi:predicted DNA-binding protein (MmcQ/YjbR family)
VGLRAILSNVLPPGKRITSMQSTMEVCAIIFEMPDVDQLRQTCLELPDTTETLQWGEALCFKVRGKIFAIVDLSEGRIPPIVFKCTPEKFDELVEIDGISPSPYVGRYKWVRLESSDAVPLPELEDLIRQSYDLVVAKAPKRTQARRKTKSRSSKVRSTKRRSTKRRSTKPRSRKSKQHSLGPTLRLGVNSV